MRYPNDPRQNFSRSSRGQGLIEYCITGSLIALVCVAGMMILGGNFQQHLVALKTDMTGSAKNAQLVSTQTQATQAAQQGAVNAANQQASQGTIPTYTPPPPPVAPAPTVPEPVTGTTPPPSTTPPATGTAAPPPGTIAKPAANQDQMCTADGWCVNVPDKSVTDAAMTAGTLGTQMTHMIADVFTQIAQQLQATPGADPSLITMITNLANKGHTLADMQDAIEEPKGTFQQILNSKDNMAPTLDSFNSQYSQLQTYLANHPTALPKEMQAVIGFEANQIDALVSSYSFTMPDSQHVEWSWRRSRELTTQSANTICTNGGNTSTCLKST